LHCPEGNPFQRCDGRGLDTNLLGVHRRLRVLSGGGLAVQFAFANACRLLALFDGEPCQILRSTVSGRRFGR
jgi:hypothetical protein